MTDKKIQNIIDNCEHGDILLFNFHSPGCIGVFEDCIRCCTRGEYSHVGIYLNRLKLTESNKNRVNIEKEGTKWWDIKDHILLDSGEHELEDVFGQPTKFGVQATSSEVTGS